MKIVVMGYGRVGSRTTRALAAKGHEITVVDTDPIHLRRAIDLPGVKLIQGNGIDADVQREAGVGEADRLLALTKEDNVNLMAAQVARVFFNVPQAIARVWEPSHAEACDDPKLITICPTLHAVEAVVTCVDPTAAGELGGTPAEPAPRTPVAARSAESDESRFVLISGGGKVGFNLARRLHRAGQEVVLMERDWSRARQLEMSLECPVIVSDGSLSHILEAAGAGRARVLVAVTGSDQDNLIACQLAKRRFGVPKTIARASNPRNEEVLQRLGVDTTISATAIIEQVIERELPTLKIKTLVQLRRGHTAYRVCAGTRLTGARALPQRRGLSAELQPGGGHPAGDDHRPRGDTQLAAGDMVVALVRSGQEEVLGQLLIGTAA